LIPGKLSPPERENSCTSRSDSGNGIGRSKTAFTTLTIAEFEPMPSLSRDYFAAEFARTNIEFTHSWTWIRGKHSFTWDAELTGSRYNEYNVFNASGVFQFNDRVNGIRSGRFRTRSHESLQTGNGELEFRRLHYQGYYGGDNYRITSRLTLKFGLRWEPFTSINRPQRP